MKKFNKTTKIIALSILSTLTFSSIAIGTTYALFSSTSNTNILVSSGKVDVTSTIVEESIQTKQLNDTDFTSNKNSMYSGSVSIEDNKINLSNLVPGDAIKFNVQVSNKSTITTKIRNLIKIENDTGLASGLKIKIDDEEFHGLAITKWTKTSANEGNKTISIEIELSEDAGEEYQDKTCTLIYSTEAVQGNAFTKEAVVISPSTKDAITLEDNIDVYFAPGEYDDIFSLYFDDKENISLIGCESAHFDSFRTGASYSYYHDNDSPNKLNSTFIIDGLNVKKQLEVNIADQKFIAKNCKTSQICALTYKIENMDLKFINNTFKRDESYAYPDYSIAKDGGIFLTANTNNYNLTIDNNSFENYIEDAIKVYANKSTTGANYIEVLNNNFISFGYDLTPDIDGSYNWSYNEAAFSIYDDAKYAPKNVTTEVTNLQKELAQTIYDSNTFNELTKGHSFYAAQFNEINYNELI